MDMTIGEALKKGKITIDPLILLADKLRSEGKPDEALSVVNKFLNDNYGNVPALSLASHILIDAERFGLAHAVTQAALSIAPDEPVLLTNMGICYEKQQNLEEAEKYLVKALQRKPNDDLTLTNLGFIYLHKGLPERSAVMSQKALTIAPHIPHARFNLGQAQLMMGQWEEGWKNYEANLGKHMGRRERVYGAIPRWTGDNNMVLIAYGEQGIGDEISFASCIPDLQKENTVIIECDHRLTGLFKRSFGCDVYGTRYKKGGVEWPRRYPVDATVAFGSLPGFYRNDSAAFPGTPYLKADPERRVQWRALLDSLGDKPKIGITWTGGISRTMAKRRSLELEQLLPLLKQDATFVSLQYKDCQPELEALYETHGVKVHHWPHAMQTNDYDDTAALVAELDLVVTVQQTAVHLAGALGVPTWVLIPKAPHWRYGLTGSEMPWYKSVRLYRRRENWAETIGHLSDDLAEFLKKNRKLVIASR